MAGKSSTSTGEKAKPTSSSTNAITSVSASHRTSEQKLEHFVAELRQDANRFERYWLRQHKEKPERFPMAMGGGEWWEQFLAWCEMTGEEA